MKYVPAALLAAVALIAGCVFTVPYDRPEDPNSPTVFINAPDRGGFLYFKNGEDCSGTVELPGEFFENGKLVEPFPVPGNKTMAIALIDRYVKSEDNDTVYVTCTAMTSFTPNMNTEYAVNYLAADKSCGAAVFSRLKGSDDKFYLLESALVREPVNAMTATSASCKSIEE